MKTINYEEIKKRIQHLHEKYMETKNDQYLMEDDSIMHFFGCEGYKTYESIANFCIQNGIERVVDIGSAYGHQKEIFDQQQIDYLGINPSPLDFWKNSGSDYIVGSYPCKVPVKKGDLAVSVLCLTWNCYLYEGEKTLHEQCQALSKDFDHCLLYTTNDKVDVLQAYFKKVVQIGRDLFYFSNESKPAVTGKN